MVMLDVTVNLQWGGSFCILLLAVLHWKKISTELKIVGIYAAFSVFFQLVQNISLAFPNHRYNTVIGNLFLPIEISTLTLAYFFAFKNSRLRYVPLVLCTLFLILYVFTIIEHAKTLNGVNEALRDAIMIICSILYFHTLLKNLPPQGLLKLPMFWVNTAILLYFSCTFILSLSLNYLIEILKDDLIGYWSFRNFLRAIFCAIICWGFWITRQSGDQPPKNTIT